MVKETDNKHIHVYEICLGVIAKKLQSKCKEEHKQGKKLKMACRRSILAGIITVICEQKLNEERE